MTHNNRLDRTRLDAAGHLGSLPLAPRLVFRSVLDMLLQMSVEEIKKELVSLGESERREVTAFLFHLRHLQDPDYQDVVADRISDRREDHWITPEEFERRLDER